MPTIYPNLEAVALYDSCPNINQSGLKEIEYAGIQNFIENQSFILQKRKFFEDKEHFLIGSACDIKMCYKKDYYDSLYHVSTLEKTPSDTMRLVLHMLMDKLSGETQVYQLNYDRYFEALYDCLNDVPVKDKKTGEMKKGYYMNRFKPNWREDTRLDDVLKDSLCINYWADIARARGKEVLTTKDTYLIDAITTNWKTHPNTAGLFADHPHIFRLYQVPVYFDIDGIQCKGLLDKIDVNIQLGIIRPYDFKTMRGHTLTFHKTLKKRRYDIQGSFYHRGLIQNLQMISDLVGVNVKGFQIEFMRFIVESTDKPGWPQQFQMDGSLHQLGESGDLEKELVGYNQLLDEYDYWRQRDFDLRALGNGPIVIDSQFKMMLP